MSQLDMYLLQHRMKDIQREIRQRALVEEAHSARRQNQIDPVPNTNWVMILAQTWNDFTRSAKRRVAMNEE